MNPTRRRSTMDPDVEIIPQTIKHSLYFEDGNIILTVPNHRESELHLFKCHKGVLLKYSRVFADMFELAEESEEFDGLPSVTLSDSWEDVDALLSLLYDPLKLPYKKHDQKTATILHGPLRLATKYKMDSLRKRFISILQRDWPSYLEGWDDNEAEISKELNSQEDHEPPFPEPAQVIRLAKECNVPSILPAAFYHLGRCYALTPESDHLQYNPPNGALLTPQDWSSLLRGRDSIRAQVTNFLYRFVSQRRPVGNSDHICHKSPPDSPDVWGCRKNIKDWWVQTSFEMLTSQNVLFSDPLEGLKIMSHMVSNNTHICSPCRGWVQGMLAQQRVVLWQTLEGHFGLDSEDGLSSSQM